MFGGIAALVLLIIGGVAFAGGEANGDASTPPGRSSGKRVGLNISIEDAMRERPPGEHSARAR